MNRSLDSIVVRYAGYLLLFLFSCYLLYLVRGAIPIFLVAGLIAYAWEPLLQRLERRGYSRLRAVGFVFLIFLLMFVIAAAGLASAWQQAQNFGSNAGKYQEDIVRFIDLNKNRIEESRLPKDVKESAKEAIDRAIVDVKAKAPGFISEKLQLVVASIGLIAIIGVVLPIITFWLMLEMNPIRARMLMLVPPAQRREVVEICANINELLGRYVRGQMIVCSLFGLLCTISFYILHLTYGMDYWLVIGVLAAFIYIVPYIGMATIALSAGLSAYFTTNGNVTCTVLAVGSCVIFNLIIDYGISPRVLGRGVGLHPLMVIFALLSGAQVGGVFGMVLAVPVFASLRVIAIRLFPALTAPITQTSSETTVPENATLHETAVDIVDDATHVEASAAAKP